MVRREIIQDGVRISTKPFPNNLSCKVIADAVLRRQGTKPEIRIFVQGLDNVKGMTVADSVLLMTVIRSVIAEAQMISEGMKPSEKETKKAREDGQGKERKGEMPKNKMRQAAIEGCRDAVSRQIEATHDEPDICDQGVAHEIAFLRSCASGRRF